MCCAGASKGESQDFESGTDDFICTALDPPIGASLNLTDYAAATNSDAGEIARIARELNITDYGTSFFSQRWLRSDGLTPNSGLITLGVHFEDQTDASAAYIRETAPLWLTGELAGLLAFRFDVPLSDAQIRISFSPTKGNNSLTGRVNLLRPAPDATMNLSKVTKRSVLHEFGHVLGLAHEHGNPNFKIHWNVDAVYDDLHQSQGWSRAYVEANVTNRYDKSASCIGDPSFNASSVMLYPIRKNWNYDGFESPLNTEVSGGDRKCLLALYRPR